jgi:hypothetical protein
MTSDAHDDAGRFGISIVPRHRYVPAGRTAMVTETGTTEKEVEDQTSG